MSEEEIAEMNERIYPKIWNDSIKSCYESMMSAVKSMEDTISVLSKCDDTLKETGYPIDSKYIPYKQWGISIMEQLLKRSQNEKDNSV